LISFLYPYSFFVAIAGVIFVFFWYLDGVVLLGLFVFFLMRELASDGGKVLFYISRGESMEAAGVAREVGIAARKRSCRGARVVWVETHPLDSRGHDAQSGGSASFSFRALAWPAGDGRARAAAYAAASRND
jgi:hypothetical protein